MEKKGRVAGRVGNITDGQFLLFYRTSSETSDDLWRLDLKTGRESVLLATEASEAFPQ